MNRRKISKSVWLLLCTTSLYGCGSSTVETNYTSNEGQVVNIYCWNDEFKSIYESYAADIAESHGVEVNFFIISDDDNAYQINLDEALANQEKVIDDDRVDLFLIEADYAGKYVKSSYTLDVKKDIGLTDDDLKNQYSYTKAIVNDDGVQKGVTWQATPGLFAYRRSVAKQVLGTDDPDQVQQKLSTWDGFDAVADQMHNAGYYMLSGYDDSYRPFSNNMQTPWVVNNQIQIDPSIQNWSHRQKNIPKIITAITLLCGVLNGIRIRDLMEMYSVSFILHGASISP